MKTQAPIRGSWDAPVEGICECCGRDLVDDYCDACATAEAEGRAVNVGDDLHQILVDALAATAVAEIPAPEIDSEDQWRCEACGGVGWVNGGGYRYPDCKHCDGTGIMTMEQTEAYWDRRRG